MAILLDPKTLDWRMGLARSFFRQERFAEAGALCGQLIRRHSDRADLWLLQTNACIQLGQANNAAENYEIVDGLGKSTPESLAMLGDIYVNEELFDLAVEAYIRAMDKAPGGRPDRALSPARERDIGKWRTGRSAASAPRSAARQRWPSRFPSPVPSRQCFTNPPRLIIWRCTGEVTELAEGARLEIVCTVKRTEGSNPSLSARPFRRERSAPAHGFMRDVGRGPGS